jgi:hypothetical protein
MSIFFKKVLLFSLSSTVGILLFFGNTEETYANTDESLSEFSTIKLTSMFINSMQAAIKFSGYESPGYGPPIKIVVDDLIHDMTGCGTKCDPQGFYYPQSGEVYFGESILKTDEILMQGLVVHEFTHFLQHKKGDSELYSTCEGRAQLELEAHDVQNKFLYETSGVNIPMKPYDECSAKNE